MNQKRPVVRELRKISERPKTKPTEAALKFISCQLSVVSCQLSVVSCQGTGNRRIDARRNWRSHSTESVNFDVIDAAEAIYVQEG